MLDCRVNDRCSRRRGTGWPDPVRVPRPARRCHRGLFRPGFPPSVQVRLAHVWADVFPLVFLPSTQDGLGVVILNSNAETHFSFTNALGLVSTQQARGLATAMREYPAARWSWRCTTTRRISPPAHALFRADRHCPRQRQLVRTAAVSRPPTGCPHMHGHRHVDWVGACGPLRIVSAPSPVMQGPSRERPVFTFTRCPRARRRAGAARPELTGIAPTG